MGFLPLLERQKKGYPMVNSGRNFSHLHPRTKHYGDLPFICIPDFVMFMFALMVFRRLVCF